MITTDPSFIASDPSNTATTAGSDLRVEWSVPSNVILPTDIKATVPELKPGRYAAV